MLVPFNVIYEFVTVLPNVVFIFNILTTTPKKSVPTGLNIYEGLLIIFSCVDVTTFNKVTSIFSLDRLNKSPLYKATLEYIPL